MKRILTWLFVMVPLLGMAQDDLYFTSSKKAKQAARKETADMKAKTETVVAPTIVDYHSSKRSDDEYNRRYVYGGEYQNAGGFSSDDSLAARIDSVPGYYADDYSDYDMDDPELDYRYSRRLVRFHNPRLYALGSPYYWDLYYGYGAWDYLYDFYDPWYWHYGWGYGWSWGPWDCWYGGIWGWHHPYAWTYWGWGPSWGPVYYTSSSRHNYMPREYNSSRGHMAANNRIRTNALGKATTNTRTNVVGRSGLTGGRTNVSAQNVQGNGRRTSGQGYRGNSGTRGSYTDYANSRSGRSAVSTNEGGTRTSVYNRTRSEAAQRSTITRNGTTYQPSRSYSNQNSSSRTTTNRSQSSYNQINTPSTYSGSTRSSSSGGSFSGGGSYSGGGGSFGGGGGGGRGGGGGGGGRR